MKHIIKTVKQHITTLGTPIALVIALLFILTSLIVVGRAPDANAQTDTSDCSWVVVTRADEATCNAEDIGGGWFGCFDCGTGGGGTDTGGGTGGTPSCTAQETYTYDCPSDSYYSGQRIIVTGYNYPDCSTPVVISDSMYSQCVPLNTCQNPDGSVSPAPNNDPNQCPPLVCADEDDWYACTPDFYTGSYVHPGLPDSTEKYQYIRHFSTHPEYVYIPGGYQGSLTGHQQCATTIAPGNPTYSYPDEAHSCPTNPVDSTIGVTSNIAWEINPGGYSGNSGYSTISVTPDGGTTYTVTAPSCTTTTTVTYSIDGGAMSTGNSFVLFDGQDASVSVDCALPAAPTISFYAFPVVIDSGNSSILTWSSTNTTSCVASGGWSGTKSTAGTQVVSPSATTVYALVCTGPGGSATENATVTVNTDPGSSSSSGTTSANPNPAQTGQEVTWSTSCSATGGTYHYVWSGTDVPPTTTTGNTLTHTYTTTGTKTMNVEIRDASDNVVTTCGSGTLRVALNPKYIEF